MPEVLTRRRSARNTLYAHFGGATQVCRPCRVGALGCACWLGACGGEGGGVTAGAVGAVDKPACCALRRDAKPRVGIMLLLKCTRARFIHYRRPCILRMLLQTDIRRYRKRSACVMTLVQLRLKSLAQRLLVHSYRAWPRQCAQFASWSRVQIDTGAVTSTWPDAAIATLEPRQPATAARGRPLFGC